MQNILWAKLFRVTAMLSVDQAECVPSLWEDAEHARLKDWTEGNGLEMT